MNKQTRFLARSGAVLAAVTAIVDIISVLPQPNVPPIPPVVTVIGVALAVITLVGASGLWFGTRWGSWTVVLSRSAALILMVPFSLAMGVDLSVAFVPALLSALILLAIVLVLLSRTPSARATSA